MTQLPSPTGPRGNTLLLEAQPGRGGGSGHVGGNHTGSAKPLPLRPVARGLTTRGWLTGCLRKRWPRSCPSCWAGVP